MALRIGRRLEAGHRSESYQYIIMADLKVNTDVIASITHSPI